MKSYKETVDFLFAQLPMYQKIGSKAFKKGLDNIRKILNFIENPQNNIKNIHIAGTNGKGSVAHVIASILQESNYKVGIYSSPHLIDFRERIKINGNYIPKKEVIYFVEKYKKFFNDINPSFFEYTVAMAFWYFHKEKVDFAVIETGLGGRLDSTNIINPVLSIITNISLEHCSYLGNTLEKIAFEKAGIIKNKVPVIIGKKQKETYKIFKKIANDKKSKLYFAENFNFKEYIDIINNEVIYQQENIKTAISSVKIINKLLNLNIKKDYVKKGISNFKKNTNFLGRWQIIKQKPLIIVDSAHNPAAFKKVLKQLENYKKNKVFFLLAFSNDKDINSIFSILPKDAKYIFSKANVPRAMDLNTIKNYAKNFNLDAIFIENIHDAYTYILKECNSNDIVFVGGSIFFVGDFLSTIVKYNAF